MIKLKCIMGFRFEVQILGIQLFGCMISGHLHVCLSCSFHLLLCKIRSSSNAPLSSLPAFAPLPLAPVRDAVTSHPIQRHIIHNSQKFNATCMYCLCVGVCVRNCGGAKCLHDLKAYSKCPCPYWGRRMQCKRDSSMQSCPFGSPRLHFEEYPWPVPRPACDCEAPTVAMLTHVPSLFLATLSSHQNISWSTAN